MHVALLSSLTEFESDAYRTLAENAHGVHLQNRLHWIAVIQTMLAFTHSSGNVGTEGQGSASTRTSTLCLLWSMSLISLVAGAVVYGLGIRNRCMIKGFSL